MSHFTWFVSNINKIYWKHWFIDWLIGVLCHMGNISKKEFCHKLNKTLMKSLGTLPFHFQNIHLYYHLVNQKQVEIPCFLHCLHFLLKGCFFFLLFQNKKETWYQYTKNVTKRYLLIRQIIIRKLCIIQVFQKKIETLYLCISRIISEYLLHVFDIQSHRIHH